mgnify:CR=1 FL=1
MEWKNGLEESGLRVNVGKTKVMRCCDGAGQVVKTGKYPCGVCGRGVGRNSIKCTSCKAWIHKRCSGISGKLKDSGDYRCKGCSGGHSLGSSELKEIVLDNGQVLECVGKFCYLGDMISEGGGAVMASTARVRSAWAKFRELAPILTARGASLQVKGKIYKACVQSVLVYASETWPMRAEDLQRLERTERMMCRWMCGVTLKDKRHSTELYRRLGIVSVTDVVRRGRLRWFGHLERKKRSDWVSACRGFEVGPAQKRGRGRPKKTWGECVVQDLRQLGLTGEMAQDRVRWRGLIHGTPSNPRERRNRT